MKTKFSLSDKIFLNKEGSLTNVLNQDYVIDTLKEFIRLLKEEMENNKWVMGLPQREFMNERLNILAGDKLI